MLSVDAGFAIPKTWQLPGAFRCSCLSSDEDWLYFEKSSAAMCASACPAVQGEVPSLKMEQTVTRPPSHPHPPLGVKTLPLTYRGVTNKMALKVVRTNTGLWIVQRLYPPTERGSEGGSGPPCRRGSGGQNTEQPTPRIMTEVCGLIHVRNSCQTCASSDWLLSIC